MKNWTRENYVEEFRKMWNWIADETERRHGIVSETEYLQKHFPDISAEEIALVADRCFFCSYCGTFNPLSSCVRCGYCPINWGIDYRHKIYLLCGDDASPYEKYSQCDQYTWIQAAKLARKIANLPEKKKKKIPTP